MLIFQEGIFSFVSLPALFVLTRTSNSTRPSGALSIVNFGSGNGLLPDGTKPLPEPLLINHK